MRLRRVKAPRGHAEIALPEHADAVTVVRPSGERVQARVAERAERRRGLEESHAG